MEQAENKHELLFLVGFPTSGKTAIGKLLAKKFELPFFDTDQQIEQNTGKTIAQIFEQEGEESFRIMEKELIQSFTIQKGIVATGGGLPCFHSNMEKLSALGTVVYLDLDFELLLGRFRANAEQKTRPLLSQEEDLRQVLEKLWNKRSAIYEQATVRIEVARKSKKDLVNEIFETVK